MKLLIRFICFFVSGLFLFLLYIGGLVTIVFEGLFPYVVMTEVNELLLFLAIFTFAFLSGAYFLGQFFVNPLLHILSMIKQLSIENYDLSYFDKKVYQNGKLKKRYFLYKEVISDLILLSDHLNQATNARKQLESAKRDWIKGISHDLKTPLSYIVGYSALMLNDNYSFQKEETSHFLSEIYTKGNYIEELIHDLNLTFKLDTLKAQMPLTTEIFDLVVFLQDLVADIVNSPDASMYEFSFQTMQQCLLIEADKKLLYRAYLNLLINAIKHNKEGTKICVSLHSPSFDHVGIDIIDNGIGLDEQELAHLFTQYYHNEKNSSNKNQGLGLSIVKGIIEAHKGTLTVTSTQSFGSTFHTVLPLQGKKGEDD